MRAASHARLTFNTRSPQHAELEIEHLRRGRLLARETRPLVAGTTAADIKTHPAASHIRCALRIQGEPPQEAAFHIDCGNRIEPVGKHFIIIGAMKAGTTTLFELLARHPSLCRTWAEVPGISNAKEINYFRDGYRKAHRPVHYDWRFPFNGATHAWTLDVSPNYAKWPSSRSVPARIASLGADTRLAYILREPVDRVESQIAHRLRTNRDAGNLRHCIRTSSYAMQLDKFVSHIERANILLLDFEQLKRDPDAVMAQICDFLEIERFSARTVVHNRRSIDFQLDSEQRAELAEILRPDVERLIGHYGFSPAERWLRKPLSRWIKLPKLIR